MRRGLTALITTVAVVIVLALAAAVWALSALLSAPGPAPLEKQPGPAGADYGPAEGAPALPAVPVVDGATADDGTSGEDASVGGEGQAARAIAGEPHTPGSPAAEFAVSAEWAQEMSTRTGIGARALAAYAGAAEWAKSAYPTCGIGWNTIAGIGWVESHHGTLGEAAVDADGIARPKIIGVPLDGEGATARIPDTDGGALDGDAEYDRAVGPLQFIPQTWERYKVDARGTGFADPHSIDDAAFSTARYLCSGDRDLTQDDDWMAAVFAYNASQEYADSVFTAAQYYADV
ncbi:lytic murein transglycosylase [Brevibacterium sp.]|uniref:lytic transglycosylase domain-containing protein n=1 Tax=Brevibacterium sp. TaxID=1701 RepID=UPI0025C69869|nr:lytic murein transglycosylase [Brevibacterium sp.]